MHVFHQKSGSMKTLHTSMWICGKMKPYLLFQLLRIPLTINKLYGFSHWGYNVSLNPSMITTHTRDIKELLCAILLNFLVGFFIHDAHVRLILTIHSTLLIAFWDTFVIVVQILSVHKNNPDFLNKRSVNTITCSYLVQCEYTWYCCQY